MTFKLKYIDLDKDWLYDNFITKDRTIKEISIELSIPEHVIEYKLKIFNIKKSFFEDIRYKDKDWLYEHYITKDINIYDIAKLCNASHGVIYKYLKIYSIELKPKIVSQETREKLRKYFTEKPNFKGRKHTDEAKRKCRESKLGSKNPQYGKPLSKETKKKMSIALSGENNCNYGKPIPDHVKEKIRQANTGRKHSEEEKRKQSASLKEYYRLHKRDNSNDSENRLRYHDYKYKRLLTVVRKRDNYTCKVCDVYPAYDVHHIVPFVVSKDNSLENLETLCRSCHTTIDAYMGRRNGYKDLINERSKL